MSGNLPGRQILTVRQKEILAVVQELGFTTIETLAARFGVSAQTIRREIIRLQDGNFLSVSMAARGLPPGAYALPMRRS